jgi:hypothetical protein
MATNCVLKLRETIDDRHVYECVDCGRLVRSRYDDPKMVHVECGTGRERPCVHLGDSTRVQECETCGGNWRIKVFDCAVHDECSIQTVLPDIAVCASCEQYRAQPSEEPSHQVEPTISTRRSEVGGGQSR